MIACDGERCIVQGPITMGNVTAVLAESLPLFTASHMVIDLGGVTELDSSAVSLLLEWRREADKANRRVEYVNLPANLKSLAELYGVSHLLDAR
jgi:phospholipid transport system transporter-binding protein